MMPAAKMLDPLIGIDFHLIVSAPGAPPIPIPHPSIGILFDPFDLIPKIGANVFVNGLPRGLAGSAGLMIPHFPIGGLFVKPPANDQEVFMGSKVVSADDEAFSYLGLPVLCCQCIGIPPIPRKGKKKKPKLPVGLVLPTGIVIAIPSGVFVGGPPTISLMALAFRAALGLGGKLLGKGFRRFRAGQRNSNRWRNLSQRAHRRADAMANRLGLGDVARNRVHRGICTVTGHPVDVATGKLFTDFTDLELPGPLPFAFERVWYSTSTYRGPFGHGWHHNYDTALYVTPELILHRTPDGRAVPYPPLADGEEYFNRDERCTLRREGQSYSLEDSSGVSYRFNSSPANSFPNGQLLALSDVTSRGGHRVRLHYDKLGRLREIVDSSGRSIGLEHDLEGRISALSAPHPDIPDQRLVVARYSYDERGNLISMTDALGHVFAYHYEDHLLVRETDRAGLNFYFQYDGRDEKAHCIRTWGDGGIYDRQITYRPSVTTVLDSLGNTTVYEHEAGLVTRTTDARGAVSTTLYEHGQPVETSDPTGRIVRYSYDARGNCTRVRRPDGVELHVEFDERNLPIRAVDALGGVWHWRYDEQGQLLERVDPLGASTRLSHARGLPIEIIDALGQRSVVEYDEHGNLASLIHPDGTVARFRYNALGWPLEVSDANHNIQRRTYDVCGRLRVLQESDGNQREFEYDGEGHPTHVLDHQQEIRMTYRGMGRLATRTQAGTTVLFEYDTEEQLRAIVNAHGAVYGFERGPVGEVLVERGFDGVRNTYEHDLVGRVRQVTRGDGLVAQYEYDVLDRVSAVRRSDGTHESYSYRQDGALMRAENGVARVVFERDALGRVVREQQSDYWVENQYDLIGRRTRVASSFGFEQHIELSPLGDVLALRAGQKADLEQEAMRAPFEVRFTRDALGLELSRVLPGGVQSRWKRDSLGRPLQHELFSRGQRQRARGYNWQTSERILRIIDAVAGPIVYSHDALGQLVSATYADGRTDLRLPDAVGNLFKRTDRADRRYGPAGQLLESVDSQARITRYSYDAQGNLTEKRLHSGVSFRYEWGGDGHLLRVIRPDGSVVRFEYDAMGRRIAKYYRGQCTRWVWDGDVPLHEWVQGDLEAASTEPASPTNHDAVMARRDAELGAHLVRGPPERGTASQPITWLFEPDSFTPLARLCGVSRESIVTDHLGTPLAMLSDQGVVTWSGEIDTWGELTVELGQRQNCPFRFPGQYEDAETGLYYNRFRYYDPESGQYTSQDPVGLAGGTALYSYAPDVVVACDPFGLSYGRTPGTGAPPPRLVPGTPGVVTGGSSTRLGQNMFRAMGMPASSARRGYQAQHIIPSQLRTHPVLRNLGMELDHASNGIFLPVPGAGVSPLSRHRGYHSVYNDFVRMRLDMINPADPIPSLDQQVAALRDRLHYLQRQGLPLYPSQGATLALWTRMYR